MLDVAAVAERLLAPFQFEQGLRDALVLLVALHDLGKISDSFRAMIEVETRQKFKHWELTEALLFAHDDRLAARIGGSWRQRQALYASVAGHHGQPSDLDLGGQPGLPARDRGLRAALAAVGSGVQPAAAVIDAFAVPAPYSGAISGRTLPPWSSTIGAIAENHVRAGSRPPYRSPDQHWRSGDVHSSVTVGESLYA